jgi:hypothetical protein
MYGPDNEEGKRIFELNMIKLNDALPGMMLTVEERTMLEELVSAYFRKQAPPALPWVRRDHARSTKRRIFPKL